jgi:predicted DNA-binding antitoxin AbrB/MazE fold protein
MDTVRAVFEHGVFRPIVPVELPERAEFDFEPRPVVTPSIENGATSKDLAYSEEGLRKVYEILSERYASGHTDTAARHNEHQP